MVTFGQGNHEFSGLFAGAATGGGELERLRAVVVSGGRLEGFTAARDREAIGSGFAGIDALLPAGGLRRGSLIEWLTPNTNAAEDCGGPPDRGPSGSTAGDLQGGAGAATLACAVACRLAGASGGPATIVVVDRTEWFHPPAMLPWLTAGQQLVVARPARDDDEIWAIDQALRCSGVAAVVAWPRQRGQARQRSHWQTALRRWQLAARSSGAIGLLVRPQAALRDPSWAEARIGVEPLPGGTLLERRLQLTRLGGGWIGTDQSQATELVIDLARGIEAGQRTGLPGRLREPRARTAREGGVACRAS
jgi:protein ImuA